MTATDWAHRLRAALAARGRLCVGIDPHPQLLADWGQTDDVAGLTRFTEICVEAFSSTAAVVKPQVAFFEAYGAAGLAVLESAQAELRAAGVIVVADAKRGDIGSTMAAYARAWLRPGSPLAADAVTVSPYLGVGALDPAVDEAGRAGGGVFVLARTSNPDGARLQTSRGAGEQHGRTVAQQIVDQAAAAHAPAATVGLVIGATRHHGLDLTGFTGPILAPGLGAQGARPADLPALFAGATELLLPNVSRGVLAAGPDVAALRNAVHRVRDEIEDAL